MLGLIVLGGQLVIVCAAVGPALRPRDLDADVEEVARRSSMSR